VQVLSFGQAQEKARAWFKALLEDAGKIAKPITVAEAIADYLADYRARSGRATDRMLDTINAHILPTLGSTAVRDLTTDRLTRWRNALVEKPPRRRTSKAGRLVRDNRNGAEKQRANTANASNGTAQEALRPRQATANRILTVLKAALNHAWKANRVRDDMAWRKVTPFREVDEPRIRYLTDEESIRLVNACALDFRSLVVAALLTGCDYGELRTAQVRDLDLRGHVLSVGGKRNRRPVVVTDEAVKHFSSVTVGKTAGDLIFTRADGDRWGKSHQARRLSDACNAARIVPAINFHILRHTYATRALRSGASMQYVSGQLGHKNIRTTQRHYAHVVPSDLSAAIRAVPALGIVDLTNVQPIHQKAGG
jgi:integrase